MLKLNSSRLIIFMLVALNVSCTIRKHPFNFTKNIDSAFLQSVLQGSKSVLATEKNATSARIYKAGFLQGWMEQDHFVDWAVLSKQRKNEFTSFNRGGKSEYDVYLILFETKNGGKNSFLLFTVQRPWSDTDTATGFSPFYYGILESRASGAYLLADETFKIAAKHATYTPTNRRSNKLYFLLDKQYGSAFKSDSLRIEKVVLAQDNQLSDNKALVISVDEVLGDKVSLIMRYEDTIILKP
ncbi:hypothetical protein [Pedobacter zeae]|uniref:Uncharacterized protein n=1 Tax=Pedobacter zeae TaxID=1737356 RepID=A0A7W6K8V3_9SPHI|nr:hypothetical protein [Pedobacter zeae]MBB4107343.1 hypothetical protein [Pedobacter zeae]GGH07310.1 hypothetical protein GCM10007422_24370 [Pedobacter zeae]